MRYKRSANHGVQVAYLMADISNVDNTTIKDLYERLESLSCTDTSSTHEYFLAANYSLSL